MMNTKSMSLASELITLETGEHCKINHIMVYYQVNTLHSEQNISVTSKPGHVSINYS